MGAANDKRDGGFTEATQNCRDVKRRLRVGDTARDKATEVIGPTSVKLCQHARTLTLGNPAPHPAGTSWWCPLRLQNAEVGGRRGGAGQAAPLPPTVADVQPGNPAASEVPRSLRNR